MSKFVIIDGNNLLFRAFYALPQLRNFNGEISNGVFGFANMLIKVIQEQKPDYIAVAFDKGKNTFRHKKFSEYKAQRKPTPTELISQFPILKKMLNLMNIKCLELDDIEADDIMGVLSRKFDSENIIVSADKDVLQLVNSNTYVMAPKKGISETLLYTCENFESLTQLKPQQIIDLKALMGDSSDNIPGVAGIGEVTATNLILKYGSLDGVYSNLSEIKGKLKEKLENGKENAYLSQNLATIILDYPINNSIEDFKYSFPFNNETREFFKEYQFNTLLKKEELFAEKEEEIQNADAETKFNKIEIKTDKELNDLVEQIQSQKSLAIYLNDEIFSVAFGSSEFNLSHKQTLLNDSFNLEEVLQKFKGIFENASQEKILFSTKPLLHILHPLEIDICNYFDILIARYLVNSNAKAKASLADICLEFGVSEGLNSGALIELKKTLFERLEKFELVELLTKIELPLTKVLFNMEIQGLKLDLNELEELDRKYSNMVNLLIQEIFDLAGCEFNINSPKQVAEILFNKLGLKALKNKKNSTSVEILKDMVGLHPIISKIIEYRQISKFQTTYIKAYEELVNKETCKIFTTFNQTLTATGRISSSEPNLQNIPARSEEGKNIRKLFVSSFENGKIVSADYSQIELRLLASFSKDETLIESFQKGEDIHSRTASEIFGIPIENISSELRRHAKAINFGIIYGISDYGLSQNIGTSVKSAKEYISTYFNRYPKIYEYMQKNIDECKSHGYIKTFMNRMRIVPEINSSNHNIRLFGERVAMNMPLQGGASDIIKLATINVFNRLKKENLKSKLILQVHDELVVDAEASEVEQVEKILKEEMEGAVSLDVDLKVEIESSTHLE